LLKWFSQFLVLAACFGAYDLFARDAYFAYINATRVPTFYDNIVGYFLMTLFVFFVTSRLNKKIP